MSWFSISLHLSSTKGFNGLRITNAVCSSYRSKEKPQAEIDCNRRWPLMHSRSVPAQPTSEKSDKPDWLNTRLTMESRKSVLWSRASPVTPIDLSFERLWRAGKPKINRHRGAVHFGPSNTRNVAPAAKNRQPFCSNDCGQDVTEVAINQSTVFRH